MKLRGWVLHQSAHRIYVNDHQGIIILTQGFGDGEWGAKIAEVAESSVREFLEKEAGDLEATLPFIIRNYFSLAGNVVYNSILHANQKIWRENKKMPLIQRAAASVLVGVVDQDLMAVANVGSGSAWLLRDYQMKEVAPARTFSRLVDPFSVDAEEGKAAPLMALGMQENLEPEIREFKLHHGDGLWFQSSGFKDIVRMGVQNSFKKQNEIHESLSSAQEFLGNLAPNIKGSGSLLIF